MPPPAGIDLADREEERIIAAAGIVINFLNREGVTGGSVLQN